MGEPVTDVTITDQTSISITNQGFEASKPIIALAGNGIVEISINGYAQFQYDFGNDTEVTIDSEQEDAYMGTLSNLKNRQMTGQFPILNPGENIISWTGNLTEIKVQPNSRWL